MPALLLLLLIIGTTCSSFSGATGGHRRLMASHTQDHEAWANIRANIEKVCVHNGHFARTSLDNNCSIYFVHNHKAGGTTLCNIAVQAGMRVAKPVRNCLEPDDLRGPGKEGLLARYIEDNRYQFVAHEFGPFLPLSRESSRILYVTVVRNPWDRVLSAAHHELCQKTLEAGQKAAAARHCDFDLRTATAADVVLDPCFRRAFSSVNHYVNKFSPCPTSRGGGGQPECTESNLQEAKGLLDLMSAVLITDSPDTYAQSFPALSAIVPQLRYEPSLRSGTTANSDAKHLLRNNLTAWRALVSLNEFDFRFYKHALYLAARQLKRRSHSEGAAEPVATAAAAAPASFTVVDDKPHSASLDTAAELEYHRKFCSF